MQRFQQSILAFEAKGYFGNEDEVCFICGKSRSTSPLLSIRKLFASDRGLFANESDVDKTAACTILGLPTWSYAA